MKIEPDDPRLSAWVLGELSPAEAEAVGEAVARDPELQAVVEGLGSVSSLLARSLAAPGLRPEQREKVMRAGRAPVPPRAVVAFPPRRQAPGPWRAILATAAMLALGVFIATRIETGEEAAKPVADAGSRGEDLALLPYPGPKITPVVRQSPAPTFDPPHAKMMLAAEDHRQSAVDTLSPTLAMQPLPDASRLPATLSLPPFHPASEIDLPLLVGRASYGWVRGWIRDKNELPPKDAVRIEELANAFPLPPEEETQEFAGLRVACVSMASLWPGPGRLVGVQIANESAEARSVSWSFRPGPGSKNSGVRVLASTGGGDSTLSTLPAGRRTLVLIELASAAGEAGDLVVSTGGRSKRFPAVETRDSGLKQAGLVAAFGMWLRGEGIDDSRLREILAAAGEETDPGRADSRQLVREALDIAAARR